MRSFRRRKVNADVHDRLTPRKPQWPKLFRGMRPFNLSRSIRDSAAGIELAAMSVPQALGYASIAGMPAVSGLYTLFLPLLAFATFGASRYLVVAADSATAAILAGGISPMAPVASARYVALAGMVALLTAGFLLLARLLRLGFLADFLSRTVLVGFLTGVGFQVGIAVLGEMLGLEIRTPRRTVVQLAEIVHARSAPDPFAIAGSCRNGSGRSSCARPVRSPRAGSIDRGGRLDSGKRRVEFCRRTRRHRHSRAGGRRPAGHRLARRQLEGRRAADSRGRIVLCDDRCPKRRDRPHLWDTSSSMAG